MHFWWSGGYNWTITSLVLFDDIAPKYKDRQGGYTQIFKLAPRQGDGAPMALIRFTK